MLTVRVPLSSEKIHDFENYSNWVKNNSNNLNLTDYWEDHSNKIIYKADSNAITFSGESGFYFPRPFSIANRLRRLASQLPIELFSLYNIFIRNQFHRHYDFLTTYTRAYENIWKHDPLIRWDESSERINWKELNNPVLNFRTTKEMTRKWPGSKTHILSDNTIKSYFYLQLIESQLPCSEKTTVCEIGPGTGNFTSLFYHHFKSKFFLIDLPKTFFFSFAYLSQAIPSARIALPNQIESDGFNPDDYDIIMLTPHQTHLIPEKSIDQVVNIHSMQEMNMETINFYFDMIDKIVKKGGHFFCSNRTEKIMSGKPIRFFDYPWHSNTKTIVFEPDPLFSQLTLSDIYIRLLQYC